MGHIWPNHRLQPVLITYNRASKLRATLESFLHAGLASMRLHVLDNCSSDGTPEVVKEMQKVWPVLQYHRNPFNIGGNANFLRALELVTTDYCWVIGDDDTWQLENIGELVRAIESEEADVIRLGWLVSAESRGKTIAVRDLFQRETMLIASMSMISATVVRHSLMVKHIAESYMAIGDAYPQLVPLFREITGCPLLIYSLSRDIMTHTPSTEAGYYMGDLEWFACYFRAARFLDNSVMRTKVVRELMEYNKRILGFHGGAVADLRVLLFFALKSKAYGFDQRPYFFTLLGYATGLSIVVLVAFFLYSITPQWALRPLTRYARKHQGLSTDLDEVRDFFLEGRHKRL